MTKTLVPARRGRAFALDRGDNIRVGNPNGTQVVDTWALSRADLSEHLSMEHTRAVLTSLLGYKDQAIDDLAQAGAIEAP